MAIGKDELGVGLDPVLTEAMSTEVDGLKHDRFNWSE